MNQQQNQLNRGFIPDEIKPEDFIFGGHQLSEDILQLSGQWDEFLPVKELQNKNSLETMNCVCYGTLNCLETLYKRLFNSEDNFSDRYIGVLSETTHRGNSPQRVIQCIRHNGLIDEELLPFDRDIRTWAEYYAPITDKLIEKGKEWLKEYKVGHEWLGNSNPETLKHALMFSPLGVSVCFRERNEKGHFIKSNMPDNHWVMLYGTDKDGNYKIFDHYNDVFKIVNRNYKFDFIKRYSLGEKVKAYLKLLFKNYYI